MPPRESTSAGPGRRRLAGGPARSRARVPSEPRRYYARSQLVPGRPYRTVPSNPGEGTAGGAARYARIGLRLQCAVYRTVSDRTGWRGRFGDSVQAGLERHGVAATGAAACAARAPPGARAAATVTAARQTRIVLAETKSFLFVEKVACH
eukprot:747066-Hanusia_phi.AAC.2